MSIKENSDDFIVKKKYLCFYRGLWLHIFRRPGINLWISMVLLLSPSSYFHHTTDQQIERWVVGTRKKDFIQKFNRPKRWQTTVPRNHLTTVRILASFTLKRDGGCVAGCGKILSVRSWCSCKPLRRQMLFPVLQLFIHKWMENCYTLKCQNVDHGLLYIFQAVGNILVAKTIEYKS